MQRPVSWLVQELDSILVQQKAVSCVTEKAKWWEGRRTLDSRVEVSRLKRQCWELFFFTVYHVVQTIVRKTFLLLTLNSTC